MKTFKAHFRIVEDINCPLYKDGEQMLLTDKTFSCPEGKEVCLILVRDMTQLLFTLLNEKSNGAKLDLSTVYTCSGCTGLIKFSPVEKESVSESKEESPETVVARIRSAMREIYGKDIDSKFLQAVPADKIGPVLQKFQEVVVPARSIVVHQGEPNPNLYLILSGTFHVENSGQRIAILGEGEIFGEMSYLGTGEAVASVRAIEDATLLAVTAVDFSKLLSSVTEVQVFMAKLLADRLQQINTARARDFESCMSGRLDEVVPAELFQVFHMHQKTGVLVMDLAHGEAKVSFREGCIINASYQDKKNEQAIFDMLAEKKGFYRFSTGLTAQEMKAAEIGDFMALLMEGVKRVDEESSD